MRGNFLGRSKKPYDPIERKLRPISRRDIERKIYREAGILSQLPPIRHTPTNLQRLLHGANLPDAIAGNLSYRQQLELEASLSGLPAGRTAGTLPERLVAAWLVTHGYHYGGTGNEYQQGSDWGFQVPIFGGKPAHGAQADVFLSGAVSNSLKGTVVRVNGVYWHNASSFKEATDSVQRSRMEAAGYKVSDVTDTQIMQHGPLDTYMVSLVGPGYKQ